MNQIFNITRFSRLVMYDARTNYKKYLIAVAIGFVGIFLLTYFLFVVSTSIGAGGTGFDDKILVNDAVAGGAFLIFLLFFFPILLMLSFPALSGKESTVNYLLLPASTFEKYLLEFFIRIIVAIGLFLFIFYLMANLAIIVYESHLNFRFADIVANYGRGFYIERFTFGNSITITFVGATESQDTALRSMIMIAWATIGLCMFSVRTFFSRFAFAKTLAVIISAQMVFSFLFVSIGRTLNIDEPTAPFIWSINSFLILTAIVCLILGYYNLKRKRI